MDESFIPYRRAASYLLHRLKEEGIALPVLGVICGSGLSGLSDTLEGKKLRVQYGDIPGFPAHCTVAGHKGEVVFGCLSGVPAMCFRGRFHSYEGHPMKTVVLPVYVMRCLAVKVVIVTNAAGGLNSNYKVGNVVCVSDHLAIPQLAGNNPLVGANDPELGPRFPATSNAYPISLRRCALNAAKELKFNFVEPHGTYCFVSGPMYESRAECRFLRSLGGDAVGMSTVPEIVAAHHCNMQILCLSLITNKVVMAGDEDESDHGAVANHAEVLEAVQQRAKQVQALVKKTVETIGRDILPSLPELPQVSLEIPVTSSTTIDTSDGRKSADMSTTALLGAGAMLVAAGAMLGMTLARQK
ncbi:Purine nucleoside phosphorylase 1 [Seminavis robusta]|uniref:purine-nucleoside phosphorylase n=1 Tax=Seminavis robusta TaxID=568900 RepID=A0A9N8ELP3_9STRA|nr:Purine nucleoside phosphorylase 1 [Seminavis robusta]|eukprot:Sro1292_g259990.1 Purine nucleoside phosphorylase 1 (356) ;mRNA; r:9890-11094